MQNEDASAKSIIKEFSTKKAGFWMKQQERTALNLFHGAAKRIPAYKDFLQKNSVDPDKIKTFADFQHVPPTNKKEYLRQYPLEDVTWDGTLKKPLVYSATSGSTGDSFYFPRSHQLDWEASIIHEVFLRQGAGKAEKPVLAIACFGMGVWIGGIITYQAFEIIGRRGYPVSVLTPGINKGEIFKALQKLAPWYESIILAGYPPFIKDIVDESKAQGIDLSKYNVKLLFAAEAFTESFRDYVAEQAGIKNIYLDTLNIYGTADIGTMAYETPISILMRRLIIRNPQLFNNVFPDITKTPTLAQYNPRFIAFEAPSGNILLSGDSAVPLIRYAIGDHGGVYGFHDLASKLEHHGVDLQKEILSSGISSHVYQLPFVYVYERDDFSTTLYGLQIYPEPIREVLLENSIAPVLTGKFTIETNYDDSQNQFLEINLELGKGQTDSPEFEKMLLQKIAANLRTKISEYRELSNYLGDAVLPHLVFWPAEHERYFKVGTKQRWVIKNEGGK